MQNQLKYSEITPDILALSDLCVKNGSIDPTLYTKYDVKRGLRDLDGRGVLTGLTEISEVNSFETRNGERVAIDGKLYYRGYDVETLVDGFIKDDRFGFEEVTYLLLFGELPTDKQLTDFYGLLNYYRTLPTSFVRDIIMKAPSQDMMNALARSVLTLYSYDEQPNNTSIPNVLRQCLQLIALFPVLAVYGFQAYGYYHESKSLIIHTP
ncbi:MAG: citrate/2-methylcitrate synthase, partial [Oscillospiraceae bacterium]